MLIEYSISHKCMDSKFDINTVIIHNNIYQYYTARKAPKLLEWLQATCSFLGSQKRPLSPHVLLHQGQGYTSMSAVTINKPMALMWMYCIKQIWVNHWRSIQQTYPKFAFTQIDLNICLLDGLVYWNVKPDLSAILTCLFPLVAPKAAGHPSTPQRQSLWWAKLCHHRGCSHPQEWRAGQLRYCQGGMEAFCVLQFPHQLHSLLKWHHWFQE